MALLLRGCGPGVGTSDELVNRCPHINRICAGWTRTCRRCDRKWSEDLTSVRRSVGRRGEEAAMAATDRALTGLRQMIASGELGPGAKFPPEPELCDHLGVSRSSLREATRSLAALGVIESRHGSGTYVSALAPAARNRPASLSVVAVSPE